MSLDDVFEAAGLDELETAAYLHLLKSGSIAAGSLARKIGVARTSLYGALSRLEERGLATSTPQHGVRLYAAEAPEQVNLLLSSRIESLSARRDEFRELLPKLKQSASSKRLRPKVEQFEGSDGLREALSDMLLYSDLQTFALWPIQFMLEVLSPDFFRHLNKVRIRNGLWTRAIWPANHGVSVKNHPYLGVGEEFLREIRVAPRGIEFPMGYWSYGSRTTFISSETESFGFTIESVELAETLLSQFEVLWGVSEPLRVSKSDTAKFLADLQSDR